MFNLPLVPQGVIIYNGPSEINGEKIVVVVTGLREKSDNPKTGKVIQVYIITDINPMLARDNGKDEAICGDCIHRGKTCYVNLGFGVNAVWRNLNNYPEVSLEEASELVQDRVVRLGAYGDPAAVPVYVWEILLKKVVGWTGYTHQWKKRKFQKLKRYCMASVETPAERLLAQKKGWRTYRIRIDENDPLMENEFECPAASEQGNRLTCEQCKACNGGSARKASPTVIAHGQKWKVKMLVELLQKMRE